MKPIDIARKLGISTTTLRTYEDIGLVPPVSRSASGYRTYTEEHLAYFNCVREMLPGFSLPFIAEVLREVMTGQMDSAYWLVNKAQGELRREKNIAEKICKNFYCQKELGNKQTNHKQKTMTIQEISEETGIPVTTIRHWDKIGLISAQRDKQNNYRIFTSQHIRQLSAIYGLKLAAISSRHKYFIHQVREEMQSFDYEDEVKIEKIIAAIEENLNSINRMQIRGIAALHHLCVQVANPSVLNPDGDS